MSDLVIRAFDPDDLPRVIRLLDALRCSTPYRACRTDWQQVVSTLMVCMNPMHGMVSVAEHDGELTGILIATISPLWWADQHSGPCLASDLVFHSRHGDGRGMLEGLVQWAFGVPRVIRIEMAVSSGQGALPVLRRLYESAGFTLEGTLFVRNHPKYQEALSGPAPQQAVA